MRPILPSVLLLAACALALSACSDAPVRSAQAAAAAPGSPRVAQDGAAPAASAPAAPLTFTWIGDITMGSRYGNPPGQGDAMFTHVRSQLRAADLTWGNLEGALAVGGSSKCGSATANCYAFEAPPRNAAALARAGFDGMNLANNHAHDFGDEALVQSRRALSAAHLTASGGRGEISYRTVRGQRVAVVGFASYSWSSDLTNLASAKSLVRTAAAHADIVVVIFHGGAEGSDKTHVPRGTEYAFGENRGNLRAFSYAVIDAGADLVVGSGPHVLRGMETYRHRLIAYSLGNFAGNSNFATGGTLSLSGILTVRLRADGSLVGGRFTSIRLDGHPWPALDPAHAALDLVRSVSRDDFGAAATRLDGAGRIQGG